MIITFRFDTKYGLFSDALHLKDDHNFTEDEIESMKQDRLNNWISVIESPHIQELPEIIVESVDDGS